MSHVFSQDFRSYYRNREFLLTYSNTHLSLLLYFFFLPLVHRHNRDLMHWRNAQPNKLCVFHQLPLLRSHYCWSALLQMEEAKPIQAHQGILWCNWFRASNMIRPCSHLTFFDKIKLTMALFSKKKCFQHVVTIQIAVFVHEGSSERQASLAA